MELRKIVVIGGGYAGVELVQNLQKKSQAKNLQITVIEPKSGKFEMRRFSPALFTIGSFELLHRGG